MRRCRIAPPACPRYGAPCCKDCKIQDYPSRCQNSPERCKCVEDGPPPRKRSKGKGGGRYLDWDEIARLRGLGLTIAQIAEQMDCSIQAVSDALRKRGVSKGG